MTEWNEKLMEISIEKKSRSRPGSAVTSLKVRNTVNDPVSKTHPESVNAGVGSLKI